MYQVIKPSRVKHLNKRTVLALDSSAEERDFEIRFSRPIAAFGKQASVD